MKIKQAQNLLQQDISIMSLKQVQWHRVLLLDAWRQSEAFFGMHDALKDGFYAQLLDSGASGFIPCDPWLTQNLKQRYFETAARETELLKIGKSVTA